MNNYIKKSNLKCIFSIIISSMIILSVTIGLIIRFFYVEKYIEGTEGIRGFRMFTVLSNVLLAACSFASIPYAIDGLRTKNYHLPRWIVYLLFVGVTCVTVTFIISASVLGPKMGFYEALIKEAMLWLHLISPILSVIMFIFFNNYHRIKWKTAFIAVAPIYVYLLIYVINAFFLGNWSDFYGVNKLLPWPLTVLVFIPFAFGVSTLLRLAHNKTHKKAKEEFKNYYLTSDDFKFDNIYQALDYLASLNNEKDNRKDIIVSRRIIRVLMERYNEEKDINTYASYYVSVLK